MAVRKGKPGPGKGKTNNPNGRPKGTPNKTTQEAKEFLQAILYDEFDNIKDSLARARADNDARYIDALVKLLAFIMPKQTDITTGGDKLPNQMNITVTSEKAKNALLNLDEDDDGI
jgi:hypothetical protein